MSTLPETPAHPLQLVAAPRRSGVARSLDWSQLCFGFEGADAELTGMTRSPIRRVLALNIPSARTPQQSVGVLPQSPVNRIA